MLTTALQSVLRGNPPVDQDLIALLARMTVQPSAERRALIAQTITALKAAGIWQKLDLLYITAAHDGQAALINWKSPGQFTLTGTNAPGFTVDRGVNGDGATSYHNTLFTPSTHGRTFQATDAHLGVYVQEPSTSYNAGTTGTVNLRARLVNSGGSHNFNLMGGNATPTSTTSGPQYGVATKSAVTAGMVSTSINGGALVSVAATDVALPTVPVCINRAVAAYSTSRVSALHLGGTLAQTEVSNLYAILRNWMGQVGADDVSTLPPEATALISAMTVKPDATRTRLIGNLVRDLKNAGVWDKLDLLYVTAAHHNQAGLLNWKSPGTFTLQGNNSPTFTVDRGVNSDGSTSYYETGADATNLQNFRLNYGHIGTYVNTTNTGSGVLFSSSVSGSLRMRLRSSGATNLFNVNGGSVTPTSTVTGPQFGQASRLFDSANIQYQVNGDPAVVAASNSTLVSPNNTLWLCGQTGSFSSCVISAATLGSGMTEFQGLALRNALRTYMVSIGADA